MYAGNQAAAQQTFDFQGIARRYNPREAGQGGPAPWILRLQNHYTTCAEKEAPAGHLLFKPWPAGIIPAKRGKAALPPWILRQQNHYTTPPSPMCKFKEILSLKKS